MKKQAGFREVPGLPYILEISTGYVPQNAAQGL